MTEKTIVIATAKNLKKSTPLLESLGKAISAGEAEKILTISKKLGDAFLADIPERTSPKTGKTTQRVSVDYSDEKYHPRDPRPFDGLCHVHVQVGRPTKYFYTYNLLFHVRKDFSLLIYVSQFSMDIWRKDVKKDGAEQAINEFVDLFDATGFLMGKKKGAPGSPRFN